MSNYFLFALITKPLLPTLHFKLHYILQLGTSRKYAGTTAAVRKERKIHRIIKSLGARRRKKL